MSRHLPNFFKEYLEKVASAKDEPNETFFEKHPKKIIAGGAAIAGGLGYGLSKYFKDKKTNTGPKPKAQKTPKPGAAEPKPIDPTTAAAHELKPIAEKPKKKRKLRKKRVFGPRREVIVQKGSAPSTGYRPNAVSKFEPPSNPKVKQLWIKKYLDNKAMSIKSHSRKNYTNYVRIPKNIVNSMPRAELLKLVTQSIK